MKCAHKHTVFSRFKSKLVVAISMSLFLSACSSGSISNFLNSVSSEVEIEKYDSSDGRYSPVPQSLDSEYSIFSIDKTGYKQIYVETRTDDHGSYSVFKLEYPSIDAVKNEGVPIKSLTSALEFYVDFVSMQVLDSIAFDDYSRYSEWVKNEAPKYIHKRYLERIVTAQKLDVIGKDLGIVFNNAEPSLDNAEAYRNFPVLYRDGGPRVFNKEIWNITATPMNEAIAIHSLGSATVMTDDEKYYKWFKGTNGDGFKDFPVFSDGKPHATQFDFNVQLVLKRQGESWKIIDYLYFSNRNLGEIYSNAPKRLIKWREELKLSATP